MGSGGRPDDAWRERPPGDQLLGSVLLLELSGRLANDPAGAEAEFEHAQLELDYTEMKAPLDSRIDRGVVDVGNLVGASEQTVLAEINQIDPIYAYFTISEPYERASSLVVHRQAMIGRGASNRKAA